MTAAAAWGNERQGLLWHDPLIRLAINLTRRRGVAEESAEMHLLRIELRFLRVSPTGRAASFEKLRAGMAGYRGDTGDHGDAETPRRLRISVAPR